MTQASLFTKSRRPMATPEDVEWLKTVLTRRGWQKRRDISAYSPLSEEALERKLRAIGEADLSGEIIGGNHGYALIYDVPAHEVVAAIGRWESQVKRMQIKIARARMALNRRRAVSE